MSVPAINPNQQTTIQRLHSGEIEHTKRIQQELDQRLERIPARFLVGYHNTCVLAKSTVNQVHFVATRIIDPAGEFLIIATGGDDLEPRDEHEIYWRRKSEYLWTRFTTADEFEGNRDTPHYLVRYLRVNDEEIHRRLQALDELRNSRALTPQLRAIVLAYIGYHGVFPTEQEENTAEWGKQIRIAVFSSFKSCVENGELLGINKRKAGAMKAANIVGEFLDGEEIPAQPERLIPTQPESLWNTIFSCWSHQVGRLLT